jgi:hypothetical protein
MTAAQFIVLALSGMLLGLRFRIPTLLLASAGCLLAVATKGLAGGDGLWHSALAVALSLTTLQGGYLVGISVISSTHKPRVDSESRRTGAGAIHRPAQ